MSKPHFFLPSALVQGNKRTRKSFLLLFLSGVKIGGHPAEARYTVMRSFYSPTPKPTPHARDSPFLKLSDDLLSCIFFRFSRHLVYGMILKALVF